MKVNAKITRMFPERNGVSQKTNQPWCMTDLCIEWEVSEPGCSTYEQSVIATCNKPLKAQAVDDAIKDRRLIPMSIYFEARVWSGKDGADHGSTQVRLFLPKEYYKEQ